MAPYAIIFSLGLAGLAPFCLGYAIDRSCGNEADSMFLHRGVEAAIVMAAEAAAAISGSSRDPNVERLLDLLFRGGSQYRDDGTDGDRITEIRDVFDGVARFEDRTNQLGRPGYDAVAADQVNIFCNIDRVKPHIDGDGYVDQSTAVILDRLDEKEFKACNSETLNLAFTWTPEPREEEDGSTEYYPSQVTLCPWFHQWAYAKYHDDWSFAGKKAKLAKYMIPKVTNHWPFTKVDAADLLPKTLLHEFTHTVACEERVDIQMATGGAPWFGKAYGWKAATNLARQRPPRDRGPVMNSDSYALFAEGVKLLNKPEETTYIQDNGALTTNRPQKRALPSELQYKRTPAEFEGFVTSIRAAQAAATAAAEHA